ncbi:MAG: D-alanine--D-alanine ligase [Propionibacteriaceae bacterium]|jgi:D-alanine-D-alanine ligase|nr:D-alanine--D-alanine ligase [Propionibacteriaceae bacterium]
MRITVAVLFGGKSVEHEVSVISAVQAMQNIDEETYEIVPVYLTKGNEMYTGAGLREMDSYRDIPALLKGCTRVAFVVDGDKTFLMPSPPPRLHRRGGTLIDVAFPIVHGTNVEDGALQGMLRCLNLPFVGPDVLAAACTMDKFVMKTMLKQGGFPVLDGLRFSIAEQEDIDAIRAAVEGAFSYPVIVKPVNLGSSVGIGKADDAEGLETCLRTAFSFARHVLVEPAITHLREINCAVLGDADEAEASECEEPFMTEEILSYADKYEGGSGSGKAKGASDGPSGGKSGMAGLKRRIPAEITAETRDHIRRLAVDAFQYLDCAGVTRVDFLQDTLTGEIWINELNTIPGSLAFYLFEPLGISYTELLTRLIQLALKRARFEEDIVYSFDSNILALAGGGAKGGKAGGGAKR